MRCASADSINNKESGRQQTISICMRALVADKLPTLTTYASTQNNNIFVIIIIINNETSKQSSLHLITLMNFNYIGVVIKLPM